MDLPINVLFRGVDESLATSGAPVPIEAPAPSPQAVARVLDLLGKAERPVVVVGGGAALSPGAREALEALVGSTTIPVVASSWGHGMLPADHPCLLGGLTELATLPLLVEAPDLVLLLGARRGIFLGGRGTSMIPEGATVVQVDIDGGEPGRIPVALGVQADVGELLRSLGSASRGATLPDWSEWNEATKAAQGALGMLYSDADPITASGRIHPYVVSQRVAEALDPDGILVYDGGESSAWINGFARAGRPGSWFGNGYLGGLGVGPGMAIGAQVANPDRDVVLVTGDGALGFHIQEWDTMARHALPIITVVFNNLGWGMSFHGQEALFGPDTHVVSDLPETRYDLIAESFGLHGERVEDPDEIAGAIARARASRRPSCIDIAVAPDVVHPIMDSMVAGVPEGHTALPYYEPIPPGEI